MPEESILKNVDLQELAVEAAKLELKALNAGVEFWQVWLNQAAKFSNLASETLKGLEDDSASVSETAKRFTAFGRENTKVFNDLSTRLGTRYFDEVDRLAARMEKKDGGSDSKPKDTTTTRPRKPEPANPSTGRATRKPTG